ncbi:uncharacterized protein [Bemisia tabaci]|uniref:uncharacterized protein isoform X2 n=1 Tax=Bemisia tabaci TaxID=7038 RepID=UPI003B287937
MSTGKLDTELQKLKDLLGPSEALAMIRPNMRPCPTVPCQSCMKRIGVNMKRKGQSQRRCNFSKNHYLILEFLEFVYSCKERRMPHSVEYFGRPCAKKVQIILIFWHAKIDKNICERIHGKKRLKKF